MINQFNSFSPQVTLTAVESKRNPGQGYSHKQTIHLPNQIVNKPNTSIQAIIVK